LTTFLAGFVVGFLLGGVCVAPWLLRSALVEEFKKRPWTAEEKKERVGMCVEMAQLSMQKGDPEARKRVKELRRRLINDDVTRERVR
jgi:hypothetical protein